MPKLLPKAAPRSYFPKYFSNVVVPNRLYFKTSSPKLFFKAAPESCSPKLLPKATSQSYVQKLFPNGAPHSKLLFKAAPQICSTKLFLKAFPKVVSESSFPKLLSKVTPQSILRQMGEFQRSATLKNQDSSQPSTNKTTYKSVYI